MEWGSQGSYQEKMCADLYAFYATAAITRLVGRVGLYYEVCKLVELHVHKPPPQYNRDCVLLRKIEILEQEWRTTQIIFSFFDKWVFIADCEDWFEMYISEQLVRDHDCNDAEVPEN